MLPNHCYVLRAGKLDWIHKAEIRPGDVDCTDLSLDDLEEFLRINAPHLLVPEYK